MDRQQAGKHSSKVARLTLRASLSHLQAASDIRELLAATEAFLSESEQAALWKRQAQWTAVVGGGTARSASQSTLDVNPNAPIQLSYELEDVAALAPRLVALTLTQLRYQQFNALSPSEIVRFCMLAPDPSASELYPHVAEFVDFGNTIGRWAKQFVLKGGSKNVRGDRLKWLFALVQELELLRNFDLAFHFSGAFAWELMPDIAKQAKVDLDAMLTVVKRFGDKKYWSGPYFQAMAEPHSLIPLLVYHSNSISGGFAGSESVVTRKWAGKTVSYLNITKFRGVGDVGLQLADIAARSNQWFQQQILKHGATDSDLYSYFQHVTAPSDAQLTVMRSQIIEVSRHRLSGKVTTIETFASDLTASVSARERRAPKWTALVGQLESYVEAVRLRQAPFVVCPRDAVLDGALLPLLIKGLVQTAGDVLWGSREYWLLHRMMVALLLRPALEDLLLPIAALWERSHDSMPQVAEQLSKATVELVSTNGGDAALVALGKAVALLEQTAVKLGPELEARANEYEAKLKALKETHDQQRAAHMGDTPARSLLAERAAALAQVLQPALSAGVDPVSPKSASNDSIVTPAPSTAAEPAAPPTDADAVAEQPFKSAIAQLAQYNASRSLVRFGQESQLRDFSVVRGVVREQQEAAEAEAFKQTLAKLQSYNADRSKAQFGRDAGLRDFVVVRDLSRAAQVRNLDFLCTIAALKPHRRFRHLRFILHHPLPPRQRPPWPPEPAKLLRPPCQHPLLHQLPPHCQPRR